MFKGKKAKGKTSSEPKTVNSIRISEARGISLLKRPLVQKTLKPALLIAALVMLALGAMYLNNLRTNENPKDKIALPCSDESEGSILQRSAKELNAADEFNINNLAEIVSEIEKEENYKDDVNCVYIALEYYSRSADFDQTNTLLDLYQEFLDAGQNPHESLGARSVEDINKRKEFSESYLDSNLKQGDHLPVPPEEFLNQ